MNLTFPGSSRSKSEPTIKAKATVYDGAKAENWVMKYDAPDVKVVGISVDSSTSGVRLASTGAPASAKRGAVEASKVPFSLLTLGLGEGVDLSTVPEDLTEVAAGESTTPGGQTRLYQWSLAWKVSDEHAHGVSLPSATPTRSGAGIPSSQLEHLNTPVVATMKVDVEKCTPTSIGYSWGDALLALADIVVPTAEAQQRQSPPVLAESASPVKVPDCPEMKFTVQPGAPPFRIDVPGCWANWMASAFAAVGPGGLVAAIKTGVTRGVTTGAKFAGVCASAYVVVCAIAWISVVAVSATVAPMIKFNKQCGRRGVYIDSVSPVGPYWVWPKC